MVIVAAALLLWPFAGLSWIPWLAGFVVLVVLRLLRLDKVLRNWDLHLAGLVVVAGLMLSTTPWAWALSASIGVLIAGLVQLPWWRLAAVGVVLCAISGIGFGYSSYQDLQEAVAANRAESRIGQGQIAEEAGQILRILDQTITGSQPDPELLCTILASSAEEQLATAVRAPDCRSATTVLHERLRSAPPGRMTNSAPPGADAQPPPATMVLNGCQRMWGTAAGPGLGMVNIELVDATQRTYVVSGFSACSAV